MKATTAQSRLAKSRRRRYIGGDLGPPVADMPPKGKPRPEAESLAAVTRWAYKESGGSMKAMLTALLTSESFLYRVPK